MYFKSYRFRIVLLFVTLSVLASCGIRKQGLSEDKTITLTEGKTCNIKGIKSKITFVKVLTDSRCPIGVQCIRAGEATVLLYINGKKEVFTIGECSSNDCKKEIPIGRYTFKVKNLNPYPASTIIKPPLYELELEIN